MISLDAAEKEKQAHFGKMLPVGAIDHSDLSLAFSFSRLNLENASCNSIFIISELRAFPFSG
jgi:hypothetical protein